MRCENTFGWMVGLGKDNALHFLVIKFIAVIKGQCTY